METKPLNVDALRQLYNHSRVAKAFFDHAARRERDQSETKVDRILTLLKADGNDLQRREVIELFRTLQEQGCGQFVEGRRGWPSRFVWGAEMTSIAKSAAGGGHVIEPISSEEDAIDRGQSDDDQFEAERPAAPIPSAGGSGSWYEGDDVNEDGEVSETKEYDITASPNDFNILTLYSFIKSGAVKIPGFQRNFVWDAKRASKLIESVIIGLPVPQIFLYEQERNKFLVIDGQQRLMSLYYFIKGRFPRKEKRVQLREIFDEESRIPEAVLEDDTFFAKFNLQLPHQPPGQPNKLNGLNYATLEEYKTTFDLRTIRNVIIKQNVPEGDNSSIFEIFNRLNSGGMNQ